MQKAKIYEKMGENLKKSGVKFSVTQNDQQKLFPRVYYKTGITQLTEFQQKPDFSYKIEIPEPDHRFEAMRAGIIDASNVCIKDMQNMQNQLVLTHQSPDLTIQQTIKRVQRLQKDIQLFFDSFQVNDFSVAQFRIDQEKNKYWSDYKLQYMHLKQEYDQFQDQRAQMGNNLLKIDQLELQNGMLQAKVDAYEVELKKYVDIQQKQLEEIEKLKAIVESHDKDKEAASGKRKGTIQKQVGFKQTPVQTKKQVLQKPEIKQKEKVIEVPVAQSFVEQNFLLKQNKLLQDQLNFEKEQLQKIQTELKNDLQLQKQQYESKIDAMIQQNIHQTQYFDNRLEEYNKVTNVFKDNENLYKENNMLKSQNNTSKLLEIIQEKDKQLKDAQFEITRIINDVQVLDKSMKHEQSTKQANHDISNSESSVIQRVENQQVEQK